jgi:type II secretory pathway component PulF
VGVSVGTGTDAGTFRYYSGLQQQYPALQKMMVVIFSFSKSLATLYLNQAVILFACKKLFLIRYSGIRKLINDTKCTRLRCRVGIVRDSEHATICVVVSTPILSATVVIYMSRRSRLVTQPCCPLRGRHRAVIPANTL